MTMYEALPFSPKGTIANDYYKDFTFVKSIAETNHWFWIDFINELDRTGNLRLYTEAFVSGDLGVFHNSRDKLIVVVWRLTVPSEHDYPTSVINLPKYQDILVNQ